MTNKQHLSNISLDELQEIVSQATAEAFQESKEAGLYVLGMNDKGQVVRYHPNDQVELLGTLQ